MGGRRLPKDTVLCCWKPCQSLVESLSAGLWTEVQCARSSPVLSGEGLLPVVRLLAVCSHGLSSVLAGDKRGRENERE